MFTPEKYVQQMLDMLDKSVWANTNTVFFEPTCGHGNFVSAIVERRLKAFLKKAKRQKMKNPHFYAVANTLNNLWAIDIDPQNIEFCRQRVFDIIFHFLREYTSFPIYEKKQLFREFLAHVLCCLEWQIQENEALSCLEPDPIKAKAVADKTIVSQKWFKKNGHQPINFKNTWCHYFHTCQTNNTTPIQYIRGLKILDSIIKSDSQNLSFPRSLSFPRARSASRESLQSLAHSHDQRRKLKSTLSPSTRRSFPRARSASRESL